MLIRRRDSLGSNWGIVDLTGRGVLGLWYDTSGEFGVFASVGGGDIVVVEECRGEETFGERESLIIVVEEGITASRERRAIAMSS